MNLDFFHLHTITSLNIHMQCIIFIISRIINVKIPSCLHWVDDNWMRKKRRNVVLVVVSIRDNVKEFLAPRRVGVYQQSKATFPLPSSLANKVVHDFKLDPLNESLDTS
ncbi:hypothetical protein T07_4857 [Trichinella nelsoni]|uniref:Uncharacterized protein n=1 Tax=Trichinella nelsoni TaxID=6336 RepID=A0A0V0SN19_9BILA|nr:hypothetical protein T07_4857 [Trichinella nelsoni]